MTSNFGIEAHFSKLKIGLGISITELYSYIVILLSSWLNLNVALSWLNLNVVDYNIMIGWLYLKLLKLQISYVLII